MMIYSRLARISWCLLFTILAPVAARAEWIRKVPNNQGVIVFVHGITGDATSTWTSSSGTYWPEMLTHDPVFDGQGIYVYHYPSPYLKRTYSVDEVAEDMRRTLSTDGVLSHDELTFVSHSMGGIVTRAFILKYRPVAKKIRMLYFFATPTNGSPYARINALSKNPQFKDIYPMNPDGYLANLERDWLAAKLGLRSFCGYEVQPVIGDAPIVDLASAAGLCTEPLDPIDADHITIVKPTDQNSASYRALKGAFQDTAGTTSKNESPVTPKPAPNKHPAAPQQRSQVPTQSLPAQQTPSQSCPNGICIGGDNNGNPTVNNYGPPEPHIVADSISGKNDSGYYCIVTFTTDAQLISPMFSLAFDAVFALDPTGLPIQQISTNRLDLGFLENSNDHFGRQRLQRPQHTQIYYFHPSDTRQHPNIRYSSLQTAHQTGGVAKGVLVRGNSGISPCVQP